MPLCGGTSEVKEPTDAVRDICQQIKSQVEGKQNSTYEEFVAVQFKSQVVNGTNFFIKVRTAPSQHLHLRVHRSLQGELTLSGVQDGKLLEEEIVYF